MRQRLKRVFAWIALLAIAMLLIMLVWFSVTGSRPEWILAILFCLMVVPVVIYVLLWITELIRKDR